MTFERYTEKSLLDQFDPIYLNEMKNVELMNRIDTKFVFSRNVLNQILPELAAGYRSLEVEGTKMSAYTTQYFDTDRFRFYLEHHNGRGVRYKVRIRKYEESDIFFLEIKKKHKGRTDKKRISVNDFESVLTEGSQEYIEAVMDQEVSLESKLYNSFDRITLVSKTDKERLTIDLNLGFKDEKGTDNFNHIVIAELKQERLNSRSLFYRLMKRHIIRPGGFSKYCIGAITLNPELKYNNFKRKLMLIDKLQ